MSENGDDCCENLPFQKNPFAGKPAYVPASEPCKKVCVPCQMQSQIAPKLMAADEPGTGATVRQVEEGSTKT